MSAPPKRPLFNKPAWSNPSKIGGADDLFHRSNQTYLKIVAEAEERRKKKIARLEQEREGKDAYEGRAGKRRCISDDSEDSDDKSRREGNLSDSAEEKPNDPVEEKPGDPNEEKISLGRVRVPAVPKNRCPKSEESEDITESASKHPEEGVKSRIENAKHVRDLKNNARQPALREDADLEITVLGVSRPIEDDGLPLSDDEFPELARKARETARKKRIEADSLPATQDSIYTAESDSQIQRPRSLHESTPPRLPPDPVVQILITSPLPNTEPLIVSRRISQRLKDVRLVWCERQHFSPEFIPKVFLTWNGNRLFDVTTCKSLGIAADPDGNILLKGRKDIMGEQNGQVHMEATTEEILAKDQRNKRSIRSENAEEREVEEVVPVVEEAEAGVRIILKSKDYGELKVVVKPVCA